MAKRRSKATVTAETPAEETTVTVGEPIAEVLEGIVLDDAHQGSPPDGADATAAADPTSPSPPPQPSHGGDARDGDGQPAPPTEQQSAPAEPRPDGEPAKDDAPAAKKPWQDRYAGGLDRLPGVTVYSIDNKNLAGVGHRLVYDNPADRPSKAVTKILSEGGNYYDQDAKCWRRSIASKAEREQLKALPKDSEEARALDAEIRERAGFIRDEQRLTHAAVVEQIRREQAEHSEGRGHAER